MFRLSCDVHVLILCPIKVEYVHSEQYVQGIIYTPTGVAHPLLTLSYTQTVLSPLGCVYCSSGVFVHSVGFYALVSWAIPTYSRCWYV